MCLAEKVRLEGGPFAIAHCNFHLRGEESDADEAFVRGWASKYGIECHVRHFDTLGHAASEKISTEMAARQLRYRWFGELCKEHGYEAVAVAHNANDNAETLILNLLRGTGLKGIRFSHPVYPISLALSTVFMCFAGYSTHSRDRCACARSERRTREGR